MCETVHDPDFGGQIVVYLVSIIGLLLQEKEMKSHEKDLMFILTDWEDEFWGVTQESQERARYEPYIIPSVCRTLSYVPVSIRFTTF